MAYVVPNTQLQLFKGINLDNRYMHTVHFASEAAQDAAFTAKVFKSYNDLMFRRYTDNQVKVEADATTLQGVTYMRFKNSRTNNKWYYAFVLACDYVNENTAIITYEIDVMQTWFEQGGSVLPCLVRREHTNNDTFGLNLEAEPVGSEVYDYDAIENGGTTDMFNSYSVILSTTDDPAPSGSSGEDLIKYGLFTGTKLTAHSCNDVAGAINVVADIETQLGSWDKRTQQADIVDLYTFPTEFCDGWSIHDDEPVMQEKTHTVEHPNSLDGYTPKNKKLFTYPYAFLYVTTMNGDSAQLKWEYWAGNNVGGNVTFGFNYTPLGGGCIQCYPKDYNGIEHNLDEGLVIDDFPKNSANVDAYQAWVAAGGQTRLEQESEITMLRNTASIAGGISQSMGYAQIAGKGLGDVSIGTLSDNPFQALSGGARAVQGAAGIVGTIAGTAATIKEALNKIDYQWKDASYRPNTIVGKNTPSLGVACHTLDVYFFHGHVRADEAKRIDDFFSVFGYATNRVKTPNLTGRRYWNFVQTENCQIAGDMPASSKEAIGRIFDGGITIWHNIDQIGNYAQSTSAGTINNPIV